jgi:Tfp pilus assembly protein PilF
MSEIAEAFYDDGNEFLRVGDYLSAIESFKNAIHIKTDFFAAYINLAWALSNIGRIEEAIQFLEQAVEKNCKIPLAFSNLGFLLFESKDYENSLRSCEKAIALDPNFAEAYNNMGNALRQLGRHREALKAYNKGISLNPAAAGIYSNRGSVLQEMGRLDNALADFEEEIRRNPSFPDVHYSKACLQLLRGNFEEGFALYEWRKKKKEPTGNHNLPRPLWLGKENIAGRTVFVPFELFFGDTIQFCRYLQMFDEKGARVLFAPQPKLKRLMQSLNANNIEIVDVDDSSLSYDFHCPLLSLPLAFKTTSSTIPHAVPYLAAEHDRTTRWRTRIGDNGFKIGVCWQGSDALPGRSFDPHQLDRISKVAGVRLISLQKGKGEADLLESAPKIPIMTLGEEFDAGPDAFLDTAAVMGCCDLVISCDTSIAHLAGALGVPIWVALKKVPEWRWLLNSRESRWYPSMRLFRQKEAGDWDDVFAEMHRDLRALL